MARIVGIDIGTTAIRAAVVRTGFRKLEIAGYFSVPLSHSSQQMARGVELAEAVRMLWRSMGQAPDMLVADMPGDRVSLRTVQLPAKTAKHIADVLPFELDSVLPFASETAIIDYQPIGSEGGNLQLLVAAALREQVQERLKALLSAGIEPRELAAGAAALDGLARLVPELQQEGPFLIADIGHSHTDLCILRRGLCETARTLSAGIGSRPERPPEELWRGIQRTVAAYRTAGGPPLQGVYVGGGGAASAASGWLGDALELPVEPLPLPLPPNLDPASLPLFARAVALAGCGATGGRHIDLRQGEFAPLRAAGILWSNAKLLSWCAVAVLLSVIFSIYAQRSLLLDEREAVRSKLSNLTKQVFGTATSDAGQVEKLLTGGASEDPLPRFDAFDAMEAVSAMIPADVTHDVTRLLVEVGDYTRDGRFELRGTLGTIEQRDALATQLQKNECFKEIKTGRTTPGRDASRINYQLEASIRCGEEKTPAKAKSVRRSSE